MNESRTSICFIINPGAGKQEKSALIQTIREESEKRWSRFEIVTAKPDESLSQVARIKAENFDIIVACGGDGTVNSVVNGLAETDAIMGVLPIGTGNDFAKAIKVKVPLSESFDILENGKIAPIDLVRYTGDYSGWSANTLGIGLDGLANYYSKSYKNLSGPIVYVIGAVKSAWKFRGCNVKLSIDGVTQTDHFLMMTVCNGKWEGGKFYLAPDADLSDGLANLITIKKIPFLKILFYLPFFRWGPRKWMSELETTLCKEINFESDEPLTAHADGEHVGSDIKSMNIRVEPGKLDVITGY